MKKTTLLLALVSTMLSAPAFARDGAGYIGIEGGGMILKDSTYTDVTDPTNGFVIKSNKGIDADIIAGYDFGSLRLEAEAAYKQAGVDTIDSQAVNGFFLDGKSKAMSAMVNGFLDLGPDNGPNLSVGGGVGIASVKGRFTNGVDTVSDRDEGFAWQLIAAVRTPITEKLDLGLKYRFFTVDNVRLTDGADTVEGRWRSHSLLLSLVYNFGERAAPPAPVAPPAPPAPVAETVAPAPAPAAIPGPFIVFFDFDKSNVTPEAASILDNAAQSYATTGQASIMLAGHADKSGSDQYNVALSERRAGAVKSYLAGKGVAETAITTEAFGESRPLVETADGVREPQNRRVEITFGPGSGQ